MGFIFTESHIEKIINDLKNQTRRACKPNELGDLMPGKNGSYSAVHSTHDNESRLRLKWMVGRDYAVQPGRGKYGLLWCAQTGQIWSREWANENPMSIQHFIPFRIRLLSIRREPLQDISEADAVAEGVATRKWDASQAAVTLRMGYRDLWQSINGPKSWDANPDVWVLSFEVVRS